MRAAISVRCVRARGLPARQPARLLISLARWLLNARPVAKTDALIVLLSEFCVYSCTVGMARRASLGAKKFFKSQIIRNANS